jgi:hypothetical protein
MQCFSHCGASPTLFGIHNGTCYDLGEKVRRKETSRRPRCRWKDDTKMDLREIGWGGMDWYHLAQGRDQWEILE